DRLLSADRPDLPRAAAINVCGPDNVTWNRYFLALAEKLHAPALETIGSNTLALRQLLAVPAKVALRLGFARAYAMSLAPTPGEIALFSRKADYRTDTSGNLLQFTPSIELRDGLHLNRCREAQEASLSVQ
ncbi:MAG: hypothetical protein KDJ29_14330, partial [Hyphomicrobiales bacterium]|nr:hypothetical protein [Hyphomicrobiales bacterium]